MEVADGCFAAMPCYAVPYQSRPCCVVLCCDMPCYAVLSCVMLCCAMLGMGLAIQHQPTCIPSLHRLRQCGIHDLFTAHDTTLWFVNCKTDCIRAWCCCCCIQQKLHVKQPHQVVHACRPVIQYLEWMLGRGLLPWGVCWTSRAVHTGLLNTT